MHWPRPLTEPLTVLRITGSLTVFETARGSRKSPSVVRRSALKSRIQGEHGLDEEESPEVFLLLFFP